MAFSRLRLSRNRGKSIKHNKCRRWKDGSTIMNNDGETAAITTKENRGVTTTFTSSTISTVMPIPRREFKSCNDHSEGEVELIN